MVTACSEELMLKWAVDTEKMNHRYYFENEAQDMELFERMEFQQEEKRDWEDTMKEIKKILDEWEVEIGLMNTKKFSVVDFHSICSCFGRMNIVVYDCVGRIKRTLFKGGLMSVEPELKEKFTEHLMEEIELFVRNCPTPVEWEEIMSLPLKIDEDFKDIE